MVYLYWPMLVSCVYCNKAGRLGLLWREYQVSESVLVWLIGRIEVTPTLFPLLVKLVHVTCITTSRSCRAYKDDLL